MSRPLFSQFLKFGAVGALGFLVDAIFLNLGIYAFSLSPIQAALFAYPVAVTFTWLGNRYMTFRDTAHQPFVKQWAVFALVSTVGLVFNRGTYILLVLTVPFIYDHPNIALVAGALAGMVVNFFMARNIVFGRLAQRG